MRNKIILWKRTKELSTNRDLNSSDNYSFGERFFILGNSEYAMASESIFFPSWTSVFGEIKSIFHNFLRVSFWCNTKFTWHKIYFYRTLNLHRYLLSRILMETTSNLNQFGPGNFLLATASAAFLFGHRTNCFPLTSSSHDAGNVPSSNFSFSNQVALTHYIIWNILYATVK